MSALIQTMLEKGTSIGTHAASSTAHVRFAQQVRRAVAKVFIFIFMLLFVKEINLSNISFGCAANKV